MLPNFCESVAAGDRIVAVRYCAFEIEMSCCGGFVFSPFKKGEKGKSG
jgi:hypothetical protein